jgi:16S rRNA C967 or C1407 C5-methylase (RsmB/RsmF family)
MFKAEGEQQIDAFLQRQADASLLAPSGLSGHLLPLADNAAGGDLGAVAAALGETAGAAISAQAQPQTGAWLDGFYYAVLLKGGAAEASVPPAAGS